MVSAVYDFRCNRDVFTEYDDLHKFLDTKAKKWVFQIEKGDETGYLHYQGRLSLIKKTTKQQALKLLENKFNYLEPTVSNEHRKAAFYCIKEQTRVQEPETDIDYSKRKNIFIPKHLKKDVIYYPFQNTIAAYPNDDRKCNVVIDTGGNNGKSYISQILEIRKKGFRCPQLNDFKDILQLLCCYCMDNEIRDIGHLFFDLPRAMKKDTLRGIISAIEEIKTSGRLIDVRNHFKIWYMELPNIWVFSNEHLDYSDLSYDRWNIWTINNKKELVAYETKKDHASESENDPLEYGIIKPKKIIRKI